MREVYAAWREEMGEVPAGDRGEANRYVLCLWFGGMVVGGSC